MAQFVLARMDCSSVILMHYRMSTGGSSFIGQWGWV
jgi:hypothetical protein